MARLSWHIDARFPVEVVAQIVLLVRVPGSLEKVGVSVQVGEAWKKSFLWQKDLEGEEYRLDGNWATLDMEKTFEAVIEAYKGENRAIPFANRCVSESLRLNRCVSNRTMV